MCILFYNIGRGVVSVKQIIIIIKDVDLAMQYRHALKLEHDYELVSLYDFMKKQDEEGIAKSKKRLKEINDELKDLVSQNFTA